MNTYNRLHPRNWGLRARLLASMLALTLLPVVIASTFSIGQTSGALTSSIGADYRQQASVRANRVTDLLNEQLQGRGARDDHEGLGPREGVGREGRLPEEVAVQR